MVASRGKLATGNEPAADKPSDARLMSRNKSTKRNPVAINKEVLDSIYELDKLGILNAENVTLACASNVDIVRSIFNRFEEDLVRLSKELSNVKKYIHSYEVSLKKWHDAEATIWAKAEQAGKESSNKYWHLDVHYIDGVERVPGVREYNYKELRYVQTHYLADRNGDRKILNWEQPDEETINALKTAYRELAKAHAQMTKFPPDIPDQIQNLTRMNNVIGEGLALLVHRELHTQQPSYPSPPTQIDFQLSATVVDKDKVLEQLRQFVADRDWKQFHTPENLAKSISIEAAELLELFQWDSEADEAKIEDELADVLTYCILLADQYGLDPYELVIEKLEKTKEKYPVEKSKGKSDKYDRL